jgi:predicted nucleic acid-binding protein
MNGIKYLVDTNFIIHLTQFNPLIEPFLDDFVAISFISEMELLGVFSISKDHKNNMQKVIDTCRVFEMTQSIKYIAIDLKQKYKLKLADAIIAATAINYNLTFITSDADFKKINELELIFLEK